MKASINTKHGPNSLVTAAGFASSGVTESEFSGVLLITVDNKIIAMHRDEKSEIRDPGCYGIFGGAVEPGETGLQAAVREIKEETNLSADPEDFVFFKAYTQRRDYLKEPSLLNVYTLKNIDPEVLEVYEGQGAVLLEDASSANLAYDVAEVFRDWFDADGLIKNVKKDAN